MSDAGPGHAPYERPRWMIPVAVIGVVLILVGIVLTLNWSDDDGSDPDRPAITGTSTTLDSGTTVSGG